MSRIPGTIIQASDRRYIMDKHGSLRVLDYQSAPEPTPASVSDPEMPVTHVAELENADAPETVLVAQ